MPNFRKKPVVIEAVQITDEWFDAPLPNSLHPIGLGWTLKKRTLEIDTLEGKMIGRVGDWIITGVEGERYPCKDSIFKKTYELVID